MVWTRPFVRSGPTGRQVTCHSEEATKTRHPCVPMASALRIRYSWEAHPHMLRHACGFALADQGADTRLIRDYLGHRNIQHTVRYTATNPARFERLWR